LVFDLVIRISKSQKSSKTSRKGQIAVYAGALFSWAIRLLWTRLKAVSKVSAAGPLSMAKVMRMMQRCVAV
jgi:hypothetical protein